MPRPTKLTPDVQKKIVDALMTGATIEKVCAYVGIHKDTFYSWLARGKDSQRTNKYTDFADAVTHAKAAAHINATKVLAAGMQPSQVETEVVELITETRLNTDTGKTYQHERSTQRKSITQKPGDWRAAESFLKRRDSQNWSALLKVDIDPLLILAVVKALKALDQDPATIFNEIIARAKVLQDAIPEHG